MPDLKTICKPCPNVPDLLKPRKLINRLPDLDMWVVCEDGKVEETQKELIILLDNYNMRTSDVNPILTIDDISSISRELKNGIMPEIFLPIDTHIIEYSKIKELIEKVPDIFSQAKREKIQPYLPIHPKSYRKQWQYDDEAYITINSNNGMLLSFLYLKVEGTNEDYSNVVPVLPPKKRLKIGTFKVSRGCTRAR